MTCSGLSNRAPYFYLLVEVLCQIWSTATVRKFDGIFCAFAGDGKKLFAFSLVSAGWLIAWLNQADSIWLQNWGFVTVKKKSCYSALQFKIKKSCGFRQKYLPPWRQSSAQRGQMLVLSLNITCNFQKLRRVKPSQHGELHVYNVWWRQRQ